MIVDRRTESILLPPMVGDLVVHGKVYLQSQGSLLVGSSNKKNNITHINNNNNNNNNENNQLEKEDVVNIQCRTAT